MDEDINEQLRIFNMLVDLFLTRENIEKAIEKSNMIYDIYVNESDFRGMSTILNNMGYLYLLNADYKNALAAFNLDFIYHYSSLIQTLINSLF